MMDINELYASVYASLKSVFDEYIEEKRKKNTEAEKQKEQIDKKIKELDQVVKEIEPYQRAAVVYISQEFAKKKFSTSMIENITLEKLYYQAVTGSQNITCNWEQLYEAASSCLAYYQREISKLIVQRGRIVSNVSAAEYDKKCKRILVGPEAKALQQSFAIISQKHTPGIIASKPFTVPQKDSALLFGKVAKPFPVTDGCKYVAKLLFGAAFLEEDNSLLLPFALPSVTLFQVESKVVQEVLGAIHAYILEFLCFTKPTYQIMNYADMCEMDSSCLGVLEPLTNEKNLIAPIPTSVEEFREQLGLLRKRLSFNRTHERCLLVYRFRQSLQDSQCNQHLQWLCANASNYNVQIIVVQEIVPHMQDFERQVPNWLPPDPVVIRRGESQYLEISKAKRRIAMYSEPKELDPVFLDELLKAYTPKPLQTRYFEIRSSNTVPLYQRHRKKPVSLLYGIGEDGEKYTLDLNGSDFSAFILGAARSGKSNLLNILITSAIMDYHPDDLELWLVDFGRTEFDRYIQHTPPHVRYVLVEKTTELVVSLVDKLISEMELRGNIMSKHHVLKMQELPENVHMPLILVIIDEFGVFKEILSSDEFEEKKKYKSYMERLLKQGAKHGISFIFSNQSYTDIYSALPEEGSDQIGLRIAMLAKRSEMKAVLEMRSSFLSTEEEMRILNLPKYQVLFRSREKGGGLSEPVHVLYFTEKDKKTQEELIERIKKVLQPIAKSRMDPSNTYHAHQQLLLDHNTTPSFHDCINSIRRDFEEWKHNLSFQETDFLLYLGEPRNMEPVHHELLRRIRAENILMYGDYARNIEQIAEVVAGAVYSASFQNWPIEYWCDEEDLLTKKYINTWKIGKKYVKKREIIAQVKKLTKQMKDNTLSKKLIIVVGLSSIVSGIQAEAEERAFLGGEKKIDESDLQRIRDLVMKREIIEVPEENTMEEMEDIAKYLNSLLDFGPRHNIHFMIVVQKEEELNEALLTINLFSHYVAFNSGMSDTQFFQLKRKVDRISETEMFGCLTGNNEFTVYTPFSL